MPLLMTVEPGFGGQPFLDMVLPKLRRARALVGGREATVWLQVDGGVGEETIERCAEAGADVFVAGRPLTAPHDPGRAAQALRAQAERATAHAAWGRPGRGRIRDQPLAERAGLVLSAPVPVRADEPPGGCVRPVSTKSLGRISSRAHTAPVNASAAVTISRSLRSAAKADLMASATTRGAPEASRRAADRPGPGGPWWRCAVEPARLEEAGNALAAHPEIPFAAATTGPTNLVASAVFRDAGTSTSTSLANWPRCPGQLGPDRADHRDLQAHRLSSPVHLPVNTVVHMAIELCDGTSGQYKTKSGLPASAVQSTCRKASPRIGKLPAFRPSRSGLPKVRAGGSGSPTVFPGNFRSATKRGAQDQRSMYSTSSARRVMVASGSAASYLGTSEFVMSTARIPTLLAPWMSRRAGRRRRRTPPARPCRRPP